MVTLGHHRVNFFKDIFYSLLKKRLRVYLTFLCVHKDIYVLVAAEVAVDRGKIRIQTGKSNNL